MIGSHHGESLYLFQIKTNDGINVLPHPPPQEMRCQRQQLAAPSRHPRQGGLATVATQVGATVAPTWWRRTTRSLLRRTTVEGTASLPAFESVLVGHLTSPFPSTKSLFLWQTTATRTNWRAAKTTIPQARRPAQ